jgi:hypothetical protein
VPGPTAPPASTKPVDSQGAATPADTTQVKLLKGTQVNLHKGLYLNIDVPVIKCLQTLAQAQQYLEVGSEPAIDTEMRRVQVLQDLSATLPADTVAYLVPGTQQDPNITLLQLREGSKLQIPTALFAQGPAQTANVSSPAPGGRRLLADPNTEVEVKLADNVTFSVNASVEALTNTPNLPVVLTSPPLASSPPAGGPNPGTLMNILEPETALMILPIAGLIRVCLSGSVIVQPETAAVVVCWQCVYVSCFPALHLHACQVGTQQRSNIAW